MKKYFIGLTALLALLIVGVVNPASAAAFPDIIPLPDGFQPEGIVIGNGHIAYAGSLANGDIYTVDLRSGAGDIFISGPGTQAVGLDFDNQNGYLYVAGGGAGDGRIYDTNSGLLITAFDFGGGFVNDVIVTQNAAFFTDSFIPVLYKVALDTTGTPTGGFSVLALSGDYQQIGGFNTNGIVASANGKDLIIVQSSQGALFHVDPETGVASSIDLGADNANNGDGLLLVGNKLYVVQNFLNQIAEFKLSPDYSSATLNQVITNNAYDIPTTVDNHGAWLYSVNARFTTNNAVDFDIVRAKR